VTGKPEVFSSRLLMIFAMLGMAVGTGNIWRFPRIAAQNGGGEFLVAWVAFLFLWSIPLILVEFGMGRKTRGGPVKAFIQLLGPRWAWMGAFIAFVASAIMFYYSVVAGWTIRYLVASLVGEIPGGVPGAFWESYTTSFWPVLTHGVAIGLGVVVVSRGVRAIEKVARVLMPSLLVLVVILAGRAVTLPGASDGLSYLFSVDLGALANAEIWIQALTQNAWDTGAGWGLVLCYAAYLRQQEDTALNAFIVPTANNMVSLFAGVMVLCTVFSVVPQLVANLQADPNALSAYPELSAAIQSGESLSPELMQSTIFGAGNEGLTFVWMPQLFARLPFGGFFMVLFFLALAFAAFTSLMAMLELATRVLVDAGVERPRAIRIVGVAGFALGLPSAISLQVLHNQDWVWAVALMLSGFFFAIAVIGSGVKKFREEQLNHEHSDIRVGKWWDVVITFVVPIEALFLIGWFLVQSWNTAREGWLNPFGVDNVGTVLAQFAVVLVGLLLLNRWLASRTEGARKG
jgi:NSS family neurotransmitter:Na+ symporter